MPVIGLNISSIEAKREKGVEINNISVSSSPTINSIKELDLKELQKKVLVIDFEFVTAYDPKAGSIKIAGELLYTSDTNAKVLESWNKNKSLPNEASVEILNFIFRKCILKILNLSDDLQLPPPVNLPLIKLKDAQETLDTKIKQDEKKKV